MQKSGSESASNEVIAVAVVPFGNDPIPLTLPKGATVADALAAAGQSSARGDLFVESERANRSDVLDAGDILSIVTSKQAGA